jgi:tRNA(fMet)-specific endonuclease VapC
VLLDTSGYSAFKRGHAGVVDLLRTATLIGLNAVVLAELLSGFAGGAREERNRQELRQFLASPRVRVLDIAAETAERFAIVHQALRRAGTPIPTHDMWIAASAMEHGLRVLTTDAHFGAVPLLLVEYSSVG